jgi:hypothetical protein
MIGGVKQNVVETELVGGGKVTHQLGAQAKGFSFRGKFLADRVATQIPALQQMANAGVAVSLTYGTQAWTVVVKDVQPTYKNQWYATYDIELVVVNSTGGNIGGGSSGPDQDQQVNQQQQQAQGLNQNLQNLDPNGTQPYQQALTQLFTDIGNAGPLGDLSSSETQALVNDVTSALAGVNAYVAAQNPTSQQYSLGTQLANVLTLIGKNIANAQTTTTITVTGGTLYHISAKYYSDATLGVQAIMAANGLSSPILSTMQPTSLVLPQLPAAA